MNYTVGIYSTTYQFQRIAGTGFKPNVPVWYATVEKTHPPSLQRCTSPTQRTNRGGRSRTGTGMRTGMETETETDGRTRDRPRERR